MIMTSDDTAVLAQIAVVVVTTIIALTGLGVAVHAYIRRARRAVAGQPRSVDDDRLQRLEHAVDAIAIEVERISEGQRFLTKLQTERPAEHARIE
jgi:hypothetical protein